jgi:hypothetical protein
MWKDKMHGGEADGKKPRDFPKKTMQDGMKHEAEHTKDKHLQAEITMDHTIKDKDYYKKLDIIEATPLSRLQKLRKTMAMRSA